MKKRIHPLKLTSMAICGALGLYVVAFVCRFDIFSVPVRDADGWLGPLARGDSQAVDIGKVWHTDTPDVSLYRTYRPLCKVWLWINGLSLKS